MALHHNPRIVTSGLVLALDAADTNSYPGSGTTWYDLSGNGNNGTLTNGPTFSSDNKGALVFDGSNDYAQFNGVTSSITTKATISAFLTISSLNEYQRILGGTNKTTISGFYTTKNINWNLYINNTGYLNLFSTTTLSEDTVYSVTGTVDLSANIYKLYINGVLESTGNITSGSDYLVYDSEFRVNSNVTSQAYGGNIHAVKVYNRALSAEEVLQNYNATKTRFGL